MSNTPLMQTPRLVIRPLAPSDWPDLARIGGQPDVARMMWSIRSPWTHAEVLDWIAQAPWRGVPGFRLAVCLSDGALIGTVGLGGRPPSCSFFIDPAYWGRGYATEAVRAVLTMAFDRYAIRAIEADHFADNPASGRVLLNLGFRKTGEGMGDSAARDHPAAILQYRLLAEDLIRAD